MACCDRGPLYYTVYYVPQQVLGRGRYGCCKVRGPRQNPSGVCQVVILLAKSKIGKFRPTGELRSPVSRKGFPTLARNPSTSDAFSPPKRLRQQNLYDTSSVSLAPLPSDPRPGAGGPLAPSVAGPATGPYRVIFALLRGFWSSDDTRCGQQGGLNGPLHRMPRRSGVRSTPPPHVRRWRNDPPYPAGAPRGIVRTNVFEQRPILPLAARGGGQAGQLLLIAGPAGAPEDITHLV